MAYTTTQRDALQAAIASGVQSVTFNNRTVTYQSLEEMRAVLAEMNRQLTPSTARAYRLAVTAKMGHAADE